MKYKLYEAYDIYVNGTCIARKYSKRGAIELAQLRSGQMFETRGVDVVDVNNGEIIYQITPTTEKA